MCDRRSTVVCPYRSRSKMCKHSAENPTGFLESIKESFIFIKILSKRIKLKFSIFDKRYHFRPNYINIA